MSTSYPTRNTKLAEEAYAQAVELFRNQFSSTSPEAIWLNSNNSIEEAHAVVKLAQEKYHARPQCKARQYLSRISSTILYYSRVLDMLAQHHPEYVALAWGTVKLMFVMVSNFEELITELSRAFARICEVLPRIEIHLELYPTDAMKGAVKDVYAQMITFYLRALRWYRSSRLKRAIGVILKPYKLQFEDIVSTIHTQSRSIESMAVAMAHQEIRQMFLVLRDCMDLQKRAVIEQGKVATDVGDLRQCCVQLTTLMKDMQTTLHSHQNVNSGILLTTQQNTRDAQVALMIHSTNSSLTQPLDSLQKSLSICRRQYCARAQVDPLWRAAALKAWNDAKESRLILIVGSFPVKLQIQVAGAHMVELIRRANVPILWALRSAGRPTTNGSIPELLKYLARQAMQLDPETVGKAVSNHFNASRVSSASSEEEWLNVLMTAISHLPQLYLVVDSEILGSAANDIVKLMESLRVLQRLIDSHSSTIFKVVFLSYRKSAITAALRSCPGNDNVSLLYLDRLLRTAPQMAPGGYRGHAARLKTKSMGGFKKSIKPARLTLQTSR